MATAVKVVKAEAGMANGNLNSAAADTKQQQQQQQHQQLLHNPGLAVEWSVEEQSILDDSLVKYGSETGVWKYIKIAALLAEKTVRDVALRCRWMTKKEIGKRRKNEEQQAAAKKPKDRKDKPFQDEKAAAGPTAAPKSNTMSMYSTPPLPIDTDDGISNEAIGGTAGDLFEQNRQVVVQIRANLAACKAQENTDLLVRFRDNLYQLLDSSMSNVGIMSHMPALQVSINSELADTILPKSLHQASQ